MNKELSYKITYINYVMTIMIVFLHSLIETNYDILIHLSNFIRTVCDMAVPMFFVISSFLLFKNKNKYYLKIKKRLKTLLIPYFIWSTIFYVIYLVLSYIPMFSKFLNSNYIVFSVNDMLSAIFSCRYVPQFWYIRILFYIVLVSFIFNILLEKGMKKTSLLIVIGLFVLNYFINLPTVNIITWLPLFWVVAWYTYFYESKIYELFSNKSQYKSIIIFFIIIFLALIISKFDIYSNMYYTWRMISPLLIIIFFKNLNLKKEIKWRHKQSFYIFTLHYFIINFIKKILIINIGENVISVVLIYIITVLITIIICLLFARLIQKKFSKLNLVLSGNRGD